MHTTKATRSLAALLLALLTAFVPVTPVAASSSEASLSSLVVSFKLDPRLSGSTYGGEHWVSPPTYTGATGQDTVEARVDGTDAKGKSVNISAEWIPEDSEMVTVSPSRGKQVKITMHRAGESKLKVTSNGVSKELLIKAQLLNNAMQVAITPLKAAQAAATPPQDAPAFSSQQEKLSYALGMNVASNLHKQAIKVDDDALVQGYRDSLSGHARLSVEDAQAILAGLRDDLRKNVQTADDIQELAEKNKQAGEVFLAENKSKEGVVTLPSGLQYKVLTAGDGKKPTLADKVVCNYRGTFLDGTVFDSSYTRGVPASFALARVIPGWQEALQLMPVGSKWQVYVPSDLAYGKRGKLMRSGKKGVAPTQRIGPNATLIFEVELLSTENLTALSPLHAKQGADPKPEQNQ